MSHVFDTRQRCDVNAKSGSRYALASLSTVRGARVIYAKNGFVDGLQSLDFDVGNAGMMDERIP